MLSLGFKKGKSPEKMIVDFGPMPVKVKSSYNVFMIEFCKESREKYPELKNTEHMKKSGQSWSAMSDEQKLKYNDLHNKDVLRHAM